MRIARLRSVVPTVLAALLLAGPIRAFACSPAPDYIHPSNFELVQDADVIVVASPTSMSTEEGGYFPTLNFRTMEVLKGSVAATFTIESDWQLGRTRPSDPNQIETPHPDSGEGACNRYTLASGKPYVLFLRKDGDGGLHPYSVAFSRINEDYAGPDSIWVRTVKTYLNLQQTLAPMAQIDALKALRASLPRRAGGRTYEGQLAQDIDGHLAAMSPWKPTGYLLAALADERARTPRRYCYGGRPLSAEFLADIEKDRAENGGGEGPPSSSKCSSRCWRQRGTPMRGRCSSHSRARPRRRRTCRWR